MQQSTGDEAVTDLTTTKRKNFSPRQRLAIWEAHKGMCCICEEKIDGTRDKWIIEHIRPLGLGGSNDSTNLGPAHERCGKDKTNFDNSSIAKAKRVKQKHIGIKKASRPIPGSKASGWKKTFSGEWIKRQ